MINIVQCDVAQIIIHIPLLLFLSSYFLLLILLQLFLLLRLWQKGMELLWYCLVLTKVSVNTSQSCSFKRFSNVLVLGGKSCISLLFDTFTFM